MFETPHKKTGTKTAFQFFYRFSVDTGGFTSRKLKIQKNPRKTGRHSLCTVSTLTFILAIKAALPVVLIYYRPAIFQV